MAFMDPKKDRYVDFWQLMMGAGFAASFVTAATFLLIPNAVLAVMVGTIFGIPTGAIACSARTVFVAMARSVTVWAIVLPAFTVFIVVKRAISISISDQLPYLAFLATVLSLSALTAGCWQLVSRVVSPEDGHARRFQFTLAEALMLSFAFAICLGSAMWWKQQAPVAIEVLTTVGHGFVESKP
jgi:hypothetical protein